MLDLKKALNIEMLEEKPLLLEFVPGISVTMEISLPGERATFIFDEMWMDFFIKDEQLEIVDNWGEWLPWEVE